MTLYAGNGDDRFFGLFPSLATVYANGGDDLWDVDYQTPGMLPNVSNYLVDYYAGTGNDVVTMDDSQSFESGRFIKLFANATGGPSSYVRWDTPEGAVTLDVQSIENVSLKAPSTSTVRVDSWADGPVTIQAGAVEFNASNYVFAGTKIHIVDTPNVFAFDNSPVAGQTGMGVDDQGPYIGRPEISYFTNPTVRSRRCKARCASTPTPRPRCTSSSAR